MTARIPRPARRFIAALIFVAATAAVGTAKANPAGRINIKFNGTQAAWIGQVALAVDPQGNLFSRGNEFGSAGSGAMTGFQGLLIKKSGVPLYGIRADVPSDPSQMGQLVIVNSFTDELVSTMPLPTDPAGAALIWKSNGVARLEFDQADHGGAIFISQFFARGFGYRKDAAQYSYSAMEKRNFVDAVRLAESIKYDNGVACLDMWGTNYMMPMDGSGLIHPRIPSGVSLYSKFDETHSDTMTHGGDDFLPWHRELLRRFEAMLRGIDPTVTVPYWDWTTPPDPLWTTDFMGVMSDAGLGHPWKWDPQIDPTPPVGSDLYNPSCDPTCVQAGGDPCLCPNSCRGDDMVADAMMNPYYNTAFPPAVIKRTGTLTTVYAGCNAQGPDQNGNFVNTDCSGAPCPPPGNACCEFTSDSDLIHFVQLWTEADQYRVLLANLGCPHSTAHIDIGGTIAPAATSARDPFFYLIHTNVDRIWATWQARTPMGFGLDPTRVYGSRLSNTAAESVTFPLAPWSDADSTDNPMPPVLDMYRHIRPYVSSAHCRTKAGGTCALPSGEGPVVPAPKGTDLAIVTPPAMYDSLVP